MFDKYKDISSGEKKILILYLILFIFNIALFTNLLAYMVMKIDMSVVHDIITFISALIILGFISTRLTRLKDMTDGSIYEIAYLIIIGLLSLTISYFNKSTNGESLWTPFLEMFKILSVVLILTYIATKSKSFKAVLKGKISRKTIIWQIVICTTLAILASYFTMDVNGVPANSRGLIVMISSLLGGPYVGIPVGMISGLWRLTMGGSTAVACCVSTIMAGVIGSFVYVWNNGKFLKSYKGALLMFLFSGFDMFLITVLTPNPQGVIIANSLYAPMTFASVLGILLFAMFLTEKKEEIDDDLKQTVKENVAKISDNADIIDMNTDMINEIFVELKEYREKVDKLERELKEVKEKSD